MRVRLETLPIWRRGYPKCVETPFLTPQLAEICHRQTLPRFSGRKDPCRGASPQIHCVWGNERLLTMQIEKLLCTYTSLPRRSATVWRRFEAWRSFLDCSFMKIFPSDSQRAIPLLTRPCAREADIFFAPQRSGFAMAILIVVWIPSAELPRWDRVLIGIAEPV